MRGHFFFMVTLGSAAISMHILLLKAVKRWKWLGEEIPPLIKFPQFEIKLFIVFSMGMIDTGLGVLAAPDTAPGWKVCGQLYVSNHIESVLDFVVFFYYSVILFV